MQIFYINLDRRPDRREFMERQLFNLGLEAERLPAVTPDELPPDALRFCNERRDRWVAPVELSCTYSHRRVWQLVNERNLPGAIVFEDDAVLASSLGNVIPRLAEALRTLDLIKIEASVMPLLMEGSEAGWLRRAFSYHYGAAGYAISNRGANKLLNYSVPDLPVDDMLFSPDAPMARRLDVRHAVPAYCIPLDRLAISSSAESASDLGSQAQTRSAQLYRSRHRLGLRMLRYGLRRLRSDTRALVWRTIGPARNAQRQTIPVDGDIAQLRSNTKIPSA